MRNNTITITNNPNMTETHMIIAKSPLYSSKLESVELFA